MQPKSQISSGYSAHKASATGAQQLSLTSSTTLHRPRNLRVRSAQAIQPTRPQGRSLVAQFDELDYSEQAMKPKSQISSVYSAHKASAPEAQHLSLTSSTTLLRPCSLRVRSAKAIQHIRPQRQEPNSSILRAQLLNSNHTAQELLNSDAQLRLYSQEINSVHAEQREMHK